MNCKCSGWEIRKVLYKYSPFTISSSKRLSQISGGKSANAF